MKLNHLNLSVTDPILSQRFLSKYFGLAPAGNPNDKICFLQDDNGLVLTLTSVALAGETEIKYPGNFHIGFIQPSEADVDRINQQLRADGYEVPDPSRQHGSWTFYFEAPGGFTVEVLA